MKNCDFPYSYVGLLEGKTLKIHVLSPSKMCWKSLKDDHATSLTQRFPSEFPRDLMHWLAAVRETNMVCKNRVVLLVHIFLYI